MLEASKPVTRRVCVPQASAVEKTQLVSVLLHMHAERTVEDMSRRQQGGHTSDRGKCP